MRFTSATALVYLLASVPAVMWAISSVLSKRGMAAGGSTLQASLTVIAINTILYGVALLLSQGSHVFEGLSATALLTFLASGTLGTAFGRLSVFAGVERVGASVNSAVISTRPLFAAVLAAGFLNEQLTASIAVGVAVLVLGLAVLALSRGGDINEWEAHELLFPLAAAGCFAVGNVLRRFGLLSSSTTVLEGVTINAMAALTVLGCYTFARSQTNVLRASLESHAYFASAGVVTAVSILSLFTALSLPEGRVAIVDALAATSPLFTVAFSSVFLRDLERVSRGIVLGSLLVVLGVVFITSGPRLLHLI